MTDISITKARPDDAHALLSMVHALAAHHGDTPKATEASLARDLSDGWLYGLIARSAQGDLGYLLLTPQAQAQHGLRGMDLHHLFVRPHARDHGVGTALIQAAETLALECGATYMVVGANTDNAKGREFYLARGYQQRTTASIRFRKSLP
jgi:GNAT superfamily N-acetyltransferase